MRQVSPINLQADLIVQTMDRAQGLSIAAYDESFLLNTISQRLVETGIPSVDAYIDCLAKNRAEAEDLFESLNIHHSAFFRNPLTFALLEQYILPALSAATQQSGRSEIRVWSAGCASGQEAWSIAMLLSDLAAARERPQPFRIFATDVSAPALATARQGVYDRMAVQNVRLKHLLEYFSPAGEGYVVAPRLRAHVDFSLYDLLDERSSCPQASLFGDFDLIFCCNVLLYYRADIRQRILAKISRALAPGGYLVTDEVERECVANHHGLHAVALPAAVFKKDAG
ncbi:MAG: protein-glutamate O-methyltransferase CheR [Lentisphaerota bacterium]